MSGIPHYRGRFAPSPTGPLHFGSLVAALGSYLQARSSGGEWLVRIEDLDPPREIAGAADAILFTLDHLGLEWDGPVVYQSTRQHRYREALDRLDTLGVLYPCSCSRSEIAARASPGTEGWIYPGTCRNRTAVGKHLALRTRTHNDPIAFIDTIQGEYGQRLETGVGDFVVKRADGLIAYQLAVVVDDAAQGITEVVRGSDLLNATPRQLYLQQLLGFPPPRYAHLPVATNDLGHKLSKQTGAQPLTQGAGNRYLLEALTFLGQAVSDDLRYATQAEILRWAVDHWDLHRVPRSSGLVWHPPEAWSR
ncbi:MAG: tRNA glutamyl-Q(34) synthetase GluQRS [Proteobacteria bacterium]|nr:MAG: tRNA glutamyl-Q(34) synthetase GluQRS [Pseudomonadota bacterium]QKK12233.1 MAG: tRNA glutamyl-Q(34) synthetase GluQRS [Pseudomonadota bacterium]